MTKQTHKSHSSSKTAAIIFLCFVSSFFGSWVFLSTGLVKQDVTQTINNNRENIVLQEGEVVAGVAKTISPSVVSIVSGGGVSAMPGGPATMQVQSSGTGIILSKDGYIITNKHVIDDSGGRTNIVLSDGTRYRDVKIVGADPLNDIAFLKIKDAKNLEPAKLGNSQNITIGEKVIAIGNALGQFKNTVTSGIISGIGRPIVAESGGNPERLEGLLQTDAAINPGNSGGPLVNLAGEVIGINTAVAADAEGIGFAIPINATKGLIRGVLKNGRVERSYLGVQYLSIDPDVAEEFHLSVKQGAFLHNSNNLSSAIIAGGPAAKAGLKDKDIIIKVNDVEVSEKNSLSGLLSEFMPGEKVSLTVLRGSQQRTIDATLGKLSQ